MKNVFNKVSDITVKDLINCLQDCRPDAEVYISFSYKKSELRKVIEFNNGGNYVQIICDV